MYPIKTLLLSGQNNHDWSRSTPFCKNILEKTGRFSVEITENPAEFLANDPSLESYSLLFTDYNGSDWGEKARDRFEQAVRGGTGLVVLHAANNAFSDWPAYQQMLGMSFVEGKSGHGEFHEFEVKIEDRQHPITRQLADFFTWDELYHGMVPAAGVEYTVLARAYSDPAQGGRGEHEPMAIALSYGKGRIFHLLLGHVWPHDFNAGYKGYQMVAFENEFFQKMLARGAEWAATGNVQE